MRSTTWTASSSSTGGEGGTAGPRCAICACVREARRLLRYVGVRGRRPARPRRRGGDRARSRCHPARPAVRPGAPDPAPAGGRRGPRARAAARPDRRCLGGAAARGRRRRRGLRPARPATVARGVSPLQPASLAPPALARCSAHRAGHPRRRHGDGRRRDRARAGARCRPRPRRRAIPDRPCRRRRGRACPRARARGPAPGRGPARPDARRPAAGRRRHVRGEDRAGRPPDRLDATRVRGRKPRPRALAAHRRAGRARRRPGDRVAGKAAARGRRAGRRHTAPRRRLRRGRRRGARSAARRTPAHVRSRVPARAPASARAGGVSARAVASEVVRRTFEEGAYTDRAFPAEAARAGLEGRDRRLAMRLAYGTVQRVRTLDHAMEALASRHPAGLQPALRAVLRVGAYQILFASGIPARAAVHETVELAKRATGRRTAGLANAVLRRIAEAGPGWVDGLPPALRHSYPDWVAAEWEAMLGEQAETLMAAQNEPPELAVRVNALRATRPVELGVATHGDPELPEALVIDEPFDVAASAAAASGPISAQSRAP